MSDHEKLSERFHAAAVFCFSGADAVRSFMLHNDLPSASRVIQSITLAIARSGLSVHEQDLLAHALIEGTKPTPEDAPIETDTFFAYTLHECFPWVPGNMPERWRGCLQHWREAVIAERAEEAKKNKELH